MKRLSAILLAVVIAVMMVVPVFASFDANGISYPDVYMVDDNSFSHTEYYTTYKANHPNLTYLIHKNSYGTYLIRSNNGFYYYLDTRHNIAPLDGGSMDCFKLSTDGSYWIYDWSASSYTSVEPSKTWVSDNVYDADGTLVFEGDPNFPVPPLPLWEEVGQVTQGEMVTMNQTLGGTMKVLVPCGVGLMACLAVFVLFGKRSLIFLR